MTTAATAAVTAAATAAVTAAVTAVRPDRKHSKSTDPERRREGHDVR